MILKAINVFMGFPIVWKSNTFLKIIETPLIFSVIYFSSLALSELG